MIKNAAGLHQQPETEVRVKPGQQRMGENRREKHPFKKINQDSIVFFKRLDHIVIYRIPFQFPILDTGNQSFP